MTSHRQANKLYINLIKALQDNEGAECEQVPEAFFPQGTDVEMFNREIQVAKTICADCPVIQQCLEYAIKADEPYGIWGGTTPAERHILRKRKTPAQ